MRFYLYYDSKIINMDDVLKKSITDLAEQCFKPKKNNPIDLFVYSSSNILIDSKKMVYYIIIDGYEVNSIAEKKALFSDKIKMLFDKASSYPCIGVVKFENGFNPNSIDVSPKEDGNDIEELDYEKRSKAYTPVEPHYTFDRVILDKEIIEKIDEAISIITYENKVFKEWGLNVIQPNPSSAISFFGPSGTGKTMAAEAVANKLKKKILKVSYADIESKYHGEGPKMVKAIFKAAQDNDAVLFIDEADSLLSKRLTNVTQGSEQAINSMRSQLLICLEDYHGIVIFATNLVVNYDKAFLTRLISIEFKKPDEKLREKIWEVHVRPTNNNGLRIPLDKDVNVKELSQKYEFCGREIRKAVISACVNAAMKNKNSVSQEDFIRACDKIIAEENAIKAQTA